MKMETKGETALTASGLESTLDEIGRRVLDKSDVEDMENPRAVAVQAFVVCYIRQHEEDFEKTDDGGYMYVGDQ